VRLQSVSEKALLYGYIPLPGRFKALTELLEGRIVPYYLSTSSAL
jgi:hypothetical protein